VRLVGWHRLVDDRPPVIGAPTAARKVVVFSDFECPFCRDLDLALKTLDAQHPGRFAVLRYDMPLVGRHPNAMTAAIASKCAQAERNFAAFHGLLVERSQRLDLVDYRALAVEAQFSNVDRFAACLRQPAARQGVDADMRTAADLGFESTPTFVIDGIVYGGTRAKRELEALLID
jgi:protein-disulfide isomerase